MILDRIDIDPAFCWGAPRIAGTRITTAVIAGRINAGEDREFVRTDFSSSPLDDAAIDQALALEACFGGDEDA